MRPLLLPAALLGLLFPATSPAAEANGDHLRVRLGGALTSHSGYAGQLDGAGQRVGGASANVLTGEARAFHPRGLGLWADARRLRLSLGSSAGGPVGSWDLFAVGAGVGARARLGPAWVESGIGYGLSTEPLPGVGGLRAGSSRLHAVLVDLRARLPMPAALELELGVRVPLALHHVGPGGAPLATHGQALELGVTRMVGKLDALDLGVRLSGAHRRFTAAGARGEGAHLAESRIGLALELRWSPAAPPPAEEAW